VVRAACGGNHAEHGAGFYARSHFNGRSRVILTTIDFFAIVAFLIDVVLIGLGAAVFKDHSHSHSHSPSHSPSPCTLYPHVTCECRATGQCAIAVAVAVAIAVARAFTDPHSSTGPTGPTGPGHIRYPLSGTGTTAGIGAACAYDASHTCTCSYAGSFARAIADAYSDPSPCPYAEARAARPNTHTNPDA
jgi:hypothetical protein